jgi:hypothetical protein
LSSTKSTHEISPRTRLASTGVVESDYSELFYSAHEISDCFYQFENPSDLSAYLELRRVRAREVGITEVHSIHIGPMAWVVPCLKVLPRGFSFALHWVQNDHRELLRRAEVPGVMVDFHRPSMLMKC